ncbi:ADP-ribosyltransferase [Mycobacterium colombiense]|uniref:ADP-ribosyltransferase n=1 Tax=Mycobacterium colombiense TaxID=339268 RepID=UPI000B08868E|nr:ADP-ribosyltransferase [Mycobacterium colombiense]
MAPLAVDPEALYAAGSAVGAAGEGLAASLTVLVAGFSAHTGLDAAGTIFGLAYQDGAEQLLKAAAACIHACRQCGARIQQGAANYSKVEAASTLGGGAGVLQSPPEPPKTNPPGPPGTWGKGEPPPLLWAVVESFVDDVWPDGDVDGLHAAASRWRDFGATATGMKGALNASKTLFDGQHLPEGDKIDDALSKIGDCLAQVGDVSGKLATNLDNFANQVNQAHNHIRDLLNRLGSLTDLGHDLMLIVKGDALDEIKKIADDINGVLRDLGREARAGEQGVKLGMQVVDGLVVKLEKYTRGQLKDFLGDAVGNQVATVFDTWLNANEGVLKGAVGMATSMGDLLPVWSAVDPEGYAATWTGLAKNVWKGSLFNAVLNPKEAGDTELQQIKSLLHVEDWSRDRPGLGAGENLFDFATLFLPGAGEAGAAADGAGAVARGAEAAGAAGRAGEKAAGGLGEIAGARGAFAGISKTGGDLTKSLEGVTKDLPEIKPPASGSPVALPPGKPIEPPVESAPRRADGAPGTPHAPTSAPGPSPTEVPEPGSPGGPHEPAPAPQSAPTVPGGPHGPVPPPEAPPGPADAPPGGPHQPASVPSAPKVLGGPHDPGSAPPPAPAGAPAAAPHGPTSVPAEVPREPVSVPEEVPREPASVPADGPHEPASPAQGGPHEPVSPGVPREAVPESEPREPGQVPGNSPHEPAGVPAAGAPVTPLAAAAGEKAPSAIPHAAEYAPGRATTPNGGLPVEPAPATPRSLQPVPSAKPAPHSPPPSGHPTAAPAPGRNPHLPGDAGPPGGGPKPPIDGSPKPGEGGPPEPKVPADDDAPHEPSDKGPGHDHLAHHDYPSPTDDFTPDDLSAMDDYTGLGYRDLNDALRGNAVEASQLARIEAIKSALQKLPPYRGPVVRGTDLPPEVLAQYRPGEVITEKAFLSTSTNPAVARSTAFSGNVEFRIFSNTGRDISSVSLFPGEGEILFPPGSCFYVAGKTIDPITGKTIIEMIER